MSRGLPQDPVVTRSGSVKAVTPPPVRSVAVVVDPIVVQFSGAITVVPDPPPSA